MASIFRDNIFAGKVALCVLLRAPGYRDEHADGVVGPSVTGGGSGICYGMTEALMARSFVPWCFIHDPR